MLTWTALAARLEARLKGKPGELERAQVWLSEQLGVSKQAVSNWASRGSVPADQWMPIAKVLGCSMDELLGLESKPGDWPFLNVTRERWEALHERHKGVAEDALLQAIARLESQYGKRQANGA